MDTDKAQLKTGTNNVPPGCQGCQDESLVREGRNGFSCGALDYALISMAGGCFKKNDGSRGIHGQVDPNSNEYGRGAL
jgi:hypothetical protein